jgi:hypothetical protein
MLGVDLARDDDRLAADPWTAHHRLTGSTTICAT